MRIDIRSLDFPLTRDLRKYAERRLRFALARAGDRIRVVQVRFSDVNGPRGGIDKRCRIQVSLNGPALVVIEDIEPGLYLAIDRAADRAGRSVACRLARSREHLPAEPDFMYLAVPAEPAQPTSSTQQEARK